MQRRSFLYNSGILIPAALLIKPSGWLSAEKTKVDLFLITDASSGHTEKISGIVRSVAGNYCEVNADRIKEISYSKKGFSVSTHDGKTYHSAKIVFHSPYKIDPDSKTVYVSTSDEDISVHYNSGSNKSVVRPEFWAQHPDKIDKASMQGFAKRKRHGFMCIS